MRATLINLVTERLGLPAESCHALGGGCVGEVYRVRMQDGEDLVVKYDARSSPALDIEAYMLGYLAAHSALPALAEARIVHAEVNLRPALPDNLPLVRHERQAQAGLTRINGLFRHGWLIAPALVEHALQDLPHLGPEPCAKQGTHFTTTEAA